MKQLTVGVVTNILITCNIYIYLFNVCTCSCVSTGVLIEAGIVKLLSFNTSRQWCL